MEWFEFQRSRAFCTRIPSLPDRTGWGTVESLTSLERAEEKHWSFSGSQLSVKPRKERKKEREREKERRTFM